MTGLDVCWWIALLAGSITALALLIADRKSNQHNEIIIEKMRRSPMYAELHQIIKRCRKRHVEQIRISAEGVTMIMMLPIGRKIHFSFEDREYFSLSPLQIQMLTSLIGEDLELVKDKRRYKLHKEKLLHENGHKSVIYYYTMLPVYKDAINRVPYLL